MVSSGSESRSRWMNLAKISIVMALLGHWQYVLKSTSMHLTSLQDKSALGGGGSHHGDLTLGGSCDSTCMNLDYDGGMDDILQDARQVFITMPAKSAGSTMKEFTRKCMKHDTPDNFINREDLTKKFLTSSFHLPSIIASHLYRDKTMMDLVKHATRQTLIIVLHREETDRLLSAIKHVTSSFVCNSNSWPRRDPKKFDMGQFHMEKNETHCILDEGPLVNLIESGFAEIGCGSSLIWTCNTFEAIQENAPKMVLVHYKQADKLQKLLAKHHCPGMFDGGRFPIAANVASEKSLDVYLRLNKNGQVVHQKEWLHEKRDFIEYNLKRKHDASCQGKMRHMEDDLFACKDEVMQITPNNLKCW